MRPADRWIAVGGVVATCDVPIAIYIMDKPGSFFRPAGYGCLAGFAVALAMLLLGAFLALRDTESSDVGSSKRLFSPGGDVRFGKARSVTIHQGASQGPTMEEIAARAFALVEQRLQELGEAAAERASSVAERRLAAFIEEVRSREPDLLKQTPPPTMQDALVEAFAQPEDATPDETLVEDLLDKATSKPTRARALSWKVLLATAALVLTVASCLAGYFVSHRGSKDTGLDETLAAGPLTLHYPNGWRRTGRFAALALPHDISIRSRNTSNSALVAGTAIGHPPTFSSRYLPKKSVEQRTRHALFSCRQVYRTTLRTGASAWVSRGSHHPRLSSTS